MQLSRTITRPDSQRATALVTGGLSGVGRAVVEQFGELGLNVVVLSLSKPVVIGETRHFEPSDTRHKLSAHVHQGGGRFVFVDGDVSARIDADAAVEAAVDLGGVDILVNCAATASTQTVVDHDVDVWKRVIDVNLVGAFLAIHACLPGMIERRYGRIVSIASTAAHVASPANSAYSTAKHGLLGLNKAVAAEVADLGITANTVSPGLIDTPSAAAFMARTATQRGISVEDVRHNLEASMPHGRLIRPDEVADVVTYLCSDSAASVNGTDVQITGGRPV